MNHIEPKFDDGRVVHSFRPADEWNWQHEDGKPKITGHRVVSARGSKALPDQETLPSSVVNPIVLDIIKESRRQADTQDCLPSYADIYDPGVLALAACCYALPKRERQSIHSSGVSIWRVLWPFGDEWWKPQDRRANLVSAAAFLISEIANSRFLMTEMSARTHRSRLVYATAGAAHRSAKSRASG